MTIVSFGLRISLSVQLLVSKDKITCLRVLSSSPERLIEDLSCNCICATSRLSSSIFSVSQAVPQA